MTLLLSFLASLRPVLLTLHILSVTIGFGGTTVADVLLMKFLKSGRISEKEQEVMEFLTNIIYPAFFVIAFTGFFLYVPNHERFDANPGFAFKMFASLVVFINGFLLHKLVSPNMMLIFSTHDSPKEAPLYALLRKVTFAMGAISVVSWYSAFLVAMLKNDLLLSFGTWMGIYLTILIVAILVSQYVERRIEILLTPAPAAPTPPSASSPTPPPPDKTAA